MYTDRQTSPIFCLSMCTECRVYLINRRPIWPFEQNFRYFWHQAIHMQEIFADFQLAEVIFACMKFSQICGNSRKLQNFPACKNVLFYSIPNNLKYISPSSVYCCHPVWASKQILVLFPLTSPTKPTSRSICLGQWVQDWSKEYTDSGLSVFLRSHKFLFFISFLTQFII